ncbi:MAG TPA: SH3 domain-containing protein [Candidatus Angelobacter sp.]|nr:SH3 domain-containing protein [Candidatus Angelobacter sp.]
MLLNPSRPYFLRILSAAAALALLAAPACKRGSVVSKHEYMYVSAPESSLRDRVATMFNKVSTVHNGERVEVLERARRFVRVRTDKGVEGWIEQRSLVSQEVFDGFQKLAADSRNQTVQGHGTTRAELNMHLTPSRDGEHLFQLKEGEKVDIIKRATSDKNAPKPPSPPKPGAPLKSQPAAKQPAPASSPAPPAAAPTTPAASPPAATTAATDKSKEVEPPKPVMEDWYLVRNSSGEAGWVLMRMVDLDVPLDIAQYAEGQRIVGYFVLNTVQETIDDQPKQEAQYLVLLNQPKDGLPFDYNQIRVFTRNRNKHRYETAYRERDMEGYLPVTTGHATFDKEGDLPTFTIRKMMADGKIADFTYKMNGPIVRRVLTPEEMADQKSRHDAELAARQKAKADAKAQNPNAKKKKKH